MTALARVTVFVGADIELRPRPFVQPSGERVAWLEVGDGSDVGLWGSPAALRRLAAAAIVTAAEADELAAPSGEAGALRVVQGS